MFGTLLFLIAIRFSAVIARFKHSDGHIHKVSVNLVMHDSHTIPLIFSCMHDKKCNIDNLNIIDGKKRKIILNMRVSTNNKITVFSLYSLLKNIDGVFSVALER
ncbi:hypothetical protein ACFFJN_04055 [Erwinia mallotivora]|uniref:hypothetical protein n=1 Tax=Erwinia mallotivora TaxID=69222 RepID=UPI0035E4AA25